MTKNKILGLIVFSVLLGACAAPKVMLTSIFDAQEMSDKLDEGTNAIKGSALIRQNGGGTVTCAGGDVGLVPVTNYSTERMLVLYKNDERGYRSRLMNGTQSPFANDNSEYLKMGRRAKCDAQGFFKFEKLKDGSYYIFTAIQWNVPGSYVTEGGSLMVKAAVKNSQTTEIVMAP